MCGTTCEGVSDVSGETGRGGGGAAIGMKGLCGSHHTILLYNNATCPIPQRHHFSIRQWQLGIIQLVGRPGQAECPRVTQTSPWSAEGGLPGAQTILQGFCCSTYEYNENKRDYSQDNIIPIKTGLLTARTVKVVSLVLLARRVERGGQRCVSKQGLAGYALAPQEKGGEEGITQRSM